MTTLSSAAAVAERAETDPSGAEWLFTVSFDAAGRISAKGVPFASRGSLDVFLDGILQDRKHLASISGLSPESSAAALVLAAYERLGEGLLGKLRGNFLVAIVDRAANRATIVRDPVGMHPAFYAEAGSSVHVASLQQTLLAHPDVSRRLNRGALAEHLCQRWPTVDETYFASVRRVPPGCYLSIEAGRVRVARHWNRFDGPVEFLTPAEADRFDEQLSRAVGRCFEEGRVGIFLSGGFDSVSVAAVAADYARRSGLPEPVALSLAFPHPECDERLVQTSVARTLGLPHEILGLLDAAGPRGVLGEGLELNCQMGTPLFNTWLPAYLTLAGRGRRHGVRTILTGEGGDEWLTVSPFIAADFLREGRLPSLCRLAWVWKRSFDTAWRHVFRGMFWTFGGRPLLGAALSSINPRAWDRRRANRRLSSDPTWVAPDQALRNEQKARAQIGMVEARPRGGFYARELRAFVTDPLMSFFFEEQYELGRRAGVRFLHPYWDADLVEHLYRIPPEVLTRGNRSKALVREAVDRRFPGLGFKRQRKVLALGYFSSMASAEASRFAQQFSDFSALADLGVVDPVGARAFVAGAFHQSSPRAAVQAWRLIMLEAWARTQLQPH